MGKLSIVKPINEPILNPKDFDAEWKKFSDGCVQVPKNFDVPMIIDGQKVYSSVKVKNINPSTGEVLGSCQQADHSHAEAAIHAALRAKQEWAALSQATRIQKFRDLEYVLDKWKYQLCATSSVECGYNAVEAYGEWAELMDFVRFNNFYYTELMGEALGEHANETNQLVLRPLKGFTCAVTPFNFPVAIGFHLPLVMALTGNTVVWKPSDDAPLCSYLLMLALEEAGFPHGVINMITGDGKHCLDKVLTHPELTALNFTGSFQTARAFGNYLFSTEHHRHNFPRYVAETGGKDFLVADHDIDVVDTARAVVHGAFGKSGQKCSANSVLLVDERIWPELKKQILEEASALVICNASEKRCDMGPVVSERQFDKIVGYIERAKSDPQCQILLGGNFDKSKGFYISPTIIELNQDRHALLSEEIFGPVIAVRTYKNFQDAVAMIEQHHYRLTGSVISRNETFLKKAIPVLSQLAGNFYVNRKTTGAFVNMQPFGGDGASGTNAKAGGKWYLLNFVSQGVITRRHLRSTTTQNPFAK